jgi:quercetin dioxygenase-like cupin family protein
MEKSGNEEDLFQSGRKTMKVIRLDAAQNYEPEEGWRRVSLCAQPDISIEKFSKPPGHSSPRHDHHNAQVLIVLSGRLRISTDDDEQELGVGDTAYIPGDEPHVVTNPSSQLSTGIDIFVPGRSFDFWLKRTTTQK